MGTITGINDKKEKSVKKRIGRMFVSTPMYYHHGGNIARTFGMINFLPLRVEHRADLDAFELSGISDSFDEIEFGSVVPMYELRIRSADDGKEFVEVKRQGK